jgi:hypothetical protein
MITSVSEEQTAIICTVTEAAHSSVNLAITYQDTWQHNSQHQQNICIQTLAKNE